MPASDTTLLVCLCSAEELPDPPAPVATEIEVAQRASMSRPASGVELQGWSLSSWATEEHGEEFRSPWLNLTFLSPDDVLGFSGIIRCTTPL